MALVIKKDMLRMARSLQMQGKYLMARLCACHRIIDAADVGLSSSFLAVLFSHLAVHKSYEF